MLGSHKAKVKTILSGIMLYTSIYVCPKCGLILANLKHIRQQHDKRWCGKPNKIRHKLRCNHKQQKSYIIFYYKGRLHAGSEYKIAKILNVSAEAVRRRLTKGWSIEHIAACKLQGSNKVRVKSKENITQKLMKEWK